jgi:hypothetical protein
VAHVSKSNRMKILNPQNLIDKVVEILNYGNPIFTNDVNGQLCKYVR